MPVPRPVTSSAGRPVNAAISAAAGVVLPMPISPVTSSSAPAATARAATSAPTSSAARASARLIADPMDRSAVPGRTVRRSRIGESTAMGVATPTSVTSSSAPACRAKTVTAAPPAQKFATI